MLKLKEVAAIACTLVIICILLVQSFNAPKANNHERQRRNLQEERPVIYTFFEPAYESSLSQKSLLLQLETWRTSWMNAGWKAVILTLKDAEQHYLYSHFKKAFDEARFPVSKYDQMCFYRWLAMAKVGGGWMSDYDTMPLYSNPAESLTLPNNGKFTSYQGHIPSLMVGNALEWKRMSNLMYQFYLSNDRYFYSDMLALMDIQHQTNTCIFENTKNAISVDEVYRDDTISIGHGVKIDKPYTHTNYLDVIESRSEELEASNAFIYIRDPSSLDFCPKIFQKRAIHFSHAACKTVEFCRERREIAIENWMQMFHEKCKRN